MEHKREVFPNAPLAFVTCEIRFPLAPRLANDESFEALAETFAGTFPIPEQEKNYTITIHPDGEPAIESNAVPRFRFLNKARTMSIVATQNSLAVETTDYDEWDSFKVTILRAIEAVASLAKITGVERVGLRYIDEVRVPENIADASGWQGWISEDVLGHLELIAGYIPESSQKAIHLKGPTGQLMVRYAALNGGGVVSDQPLKRRTPALDGPFFVIDTDSHRDTPNEEMLNFDPEVLAPVLDDLHKPAGDIFHGAITERSRQHFRRKV